MHTEPLPNPAPTPSAPPNLPAAAIRRHYDRIAPLLADFFGAIPIVPVAYDAQGKLVVPHLHHDAHAVADTIPIVTQSGPRQYLALTPRSLDYAVRTLHAVGFGTWTPLPADPGVPRFARVMAHRRGASTPAMLRAAVTLLQERLKADGSAGLVLQEGPWSAALWLLLDGGCAYPEIRRWLHACINDVAGQRPDLVSLSYARSEQGDRITFSPRTNAVAAFSALPYTFVDVEFPSFAAPLADATELEHDPPEFADFDRWFGSYGDRFASLASSLKPIRIPALATTAIAIESLDDPLLFPGFSQHGKVIEAALLVLADGKPRSAAEILAEAIRRKLLPAKMPDKTVYLGLIQYIERRVSSGRRPLIVQDWDRRFRTNHPADDWPAPAVAPQPFVPHPNAAQVAARLRRASTGRDGPDAFEEAVVAAFGALGFVAHHIGGQGHPDGFADAPLGVLGYRVMLEAKTATGRNVSLPDAAEAAQYREAYGADYCVIVGSHFAGDMLFAKELAIHHVTAWTVDGLVQLIEAGSDPHEMRPLFEEPGFVADRLTDLFWEREHGLAKRVAVISEVLVAEIRKLQLQLPDAKEKAPRITEDAAIVMVDETLTAAGALRPCTREEVRLAFAHLTSPLVHLAIFADDARSAIVIR